MSALLRKELRLLRPAWIMALVAATSPVWWKWDDTFYPILFFCLGALFLALAPFGQEIGCGTLGQLLAQPEHRLRFWRMKAGLGAVALTSAWLVLGFCTWISATRTMPYEFAPPGAWSEMLRRAGMIAVLLFVGGLWTTLLFRNVATAFWSTILVPGVLCSVMMILLEIGKNGNSFEAVLPFVLIPYAVGAFWFGRKLFLEAQDVAWTGAQLSLPQITGWRGLALGFNQKRGPWSALMRKEWQLQGATLSLVPVLALLHVAVLALRHFIPQHAASFGLIYSIWLIVPMVVGCVAVAEERRLNTLEALQGLPVRKRTHFALKLAVTVALGTVLGAVMPWLLEGAARTKIDLRTMSLAATGITGVAFFASTLSRGMLQAATAFLCIPVMVGLAISAMVRFVPGWEWLWHSTPLPAWLLLCVILWRAYRNYQCLQIGRPVWLANLGCMAAVLVLGCLVPAAIHQRPWEFFMSLEPVHGLPRLTAGPRGEIGQTGLQIRQTARDAYAYSDLFVLLPDGRLWVGEVTQPPELKINHSTFVPASNWVSLAVTPFFPAAVAIKSDGTLWSIGDDLPPAQIGSDSNWKEVVGNQNLFLAVKQNGTLWGWGEDVLGFIADRGQSPKKFFTPVQIGNDSDWTDIYASSGVRPMAMKRDGRLVAWDGAPGVPGSPLDCQINPKLTQAVGTNWISLTSSFALTLGVRPDGSLWACGFVHPNLFGSGNPWSAQVAPVRIGTKSDWVSVSFYMGRYYGLEASGRFWMTAEIELNVWETKQLSKYTDWIVAGSSPQATWALAKDGTLCGWFPSQEPNDGGDFRQMLRLTRRPITINILNAK